MTNGWVGLSSIVWCESFMLEIRVNLGKAGGASSSHCGSGACGPRHTELLVGRSAREEVNQRVGQIVPALEAVRGILLQTPHDDRRELWRHLRIHHVGRDGSLGDVLVADRIAVGAVERWKADQGLVH